MTIFCSLSSYSYRHRDMFKNSRSLEEDDHKLVEEFVEELNGSADEVDKTFDAVKTIKIAAQL